MAGLRITWSMMTPPTVLAATWDHGVFVLTEGGRRHELAGEAVGELAADGRGGALAIVGADEDRCRQRCGGVGVCGDRELLQDGGRPVASGRENHREQSNRKGTRIHAVS